MDSIFPNSLTTSWGAPAADPVGSFLAIALALCLAVLLFRNGAVAVRVRSCRRRS